MSLFINKELNSLIITEKNFKIDYNYLPDIMLGLMNLDQTKHIKIAINIEDTPAIFILYFKKVLQESDAHIDVYYKDSKESVIKILKGYGMQYNNINKFPDPLPEE